MTDQPNQTNPELRTSRIHGVMIDHSASQMQVRELPLVVSDEKPSGGGKNRGPSPLEYILIGLCA
jgi:uncharacterized OsmC-like protein